MLFKSLGLTKEARRECFCQTPNLQSNSQTRCKSRRMCSRWRRHGCPAAHPCCGDDRARLAPCGDVRGWDDQWTEIAQHGIVWRNDKIGEFMRIHFLKKGENANLKATSLLSTYQQSLECSSSATLLLVWGFFRSVVALLVLIRRTCQLIQDPLHCRIPWVDQTELMRAISCAHRLQGSSAFIVRMTLRAPTTRPAGSCPGAWKEGGRLCWKGMSNREVPKQQVSRVLWPWVANDSNCGGLKVSRISKNDCLTI